MTQYKYDAFISYRHLPFDKMVAEKLQTLMESYKPPKGITQVPLKGRVFRDQSELPTSGDLGSDIEDALEKSRYLIVVCSEETKNSQWCMREIEYFKSLHDGKCSNILTVLIRGNPNEVFPDSLRYETWDGVEVELEPLAANITADTQSKSIKLLKTEFLRIMAPILGCGFDDLFKRHQRRRIRRFTQIGCAGLAVAVAIGIYVIYNINMMENQRKLLAQQELITKLEQERLAQQELLTQAEQDRLAEQVLLTQAEQIMHTLKVAEELIRSGDNVMASAVLMDLYSSIANHDDLILSEIERLLFQSTYVPVFKPYAKLTHIESVTSAVNYEYFLYTAANDGTITIWSLINGEHLGQIFSDSNILAMVLDNGIIYGVTMTQNVFIYNLTTGRQESFSFFNGRDDLSSYDVDDIMFYDGTLYISERDSFKFNVRQVDLNARESSLFNDNNEEFFLYCAFDKINNRIITTEPQNGSNVLTIHHLEPDTYYRINLPDEIEYVLYGDNMNCFIAFYELANTHDFIVFKYDLNGSIIDQIFHDSEYDLFFMQYIREASVSPDGRYAAVGDNYGNILVFDLLNMYVSNYLETGYAANYIGFIDDKYLFISFDSASRGAAIARYDNYAREVFTISDSFTPQRMLINDTNDLMCLFDTQGQITLYNTGLAMNESISSLSIDDLFGTHTTDNGFIPQRDEWEVNAVSADGRFRLVTILTDEEQEYTLERIGDRFTSCWLVDNTSGERLFNANIPRDFIAVDIKDDSIATILTDSGHIINFDIVTGEIINAFSVPLVLTDAFAMLKVDYINYRLFVAMSVWSSDFGVESIGGLYSLNDGALICDFTGVIRTDFLAINNDFTKVYRYRFDNVIEIELPDFSGLIDMAITQTAGRKPTENERQMLRLGIN